jgi:hypothetical protein
MFLLGVPHIYVETDFKKELTRKLAIVPTEGDYYPVKGKVFAYIVN